jgi:magnesium-transporting ATPase (P-type)
VLEFSRKGYRTLVYAIKEIQDGDLLEKVEDLESNL